MADIDLTGGVASSVLDLVKGYLASEAQSRANEDNINLAKENRASDILLGQINRGLPYSFDQTWLPGGAQFPTGSPTQFPLYAKTGENSDELLAYKRANDIFNATQNAWGSPETMIKSYTDIANQSKPAIAGATKTINDLFSGARTQQRLSEQAPVNQARVNTAAGQRSAIYQGLQAKLNELKAKQANNGFVGSSTFDQSAQLRTAIPALQDAANTMSAAQLQNALDEQAIKNQDWQAAFANVNLPYDVASKNIAFQQMPELSAINAYNQSFGIYNPFLLKPATPIQTPAMPQVTPVMSAWGTGAGVASDFLKSYMQDQAAKEANATLAAQTKSWQDAMLASANRSSSYTTPTYYNYPYSTADMPD